jgi:hypothetical protein
LIAEYYGLLDELRREVIYVIENEMPKKTQLWPLLVEQFDVQ